MIINLQQSRGLLVLFISLLFVMCQRVENSKQRAFRELLLSNGAELKNGYYVVIPVDGCHKCVQTSIEFSLKNLNSEKINFILTSESGVKSIYNQYTKEQLSSSNFIIDKNSSFIRSGFTSGFITIIRVSSGRLKGIETLQPEQVESRLGNLMTELASL